MNNQSVQSKLDSEQQNSKKCGPGFWNNQVEGREAVCWAKVGRKIKWKIEMQIHFKKHPFNKRTKLNTIVNYFSFILAS